MAVFNEKAFMYDRNENSNEFYLSSIGILNHDKKYVVARKKSENDIIEFVIDGTGYIEVDGITSKVKKGDCYCLRKGSSHKYYSDEDEPYSKLWINISGSFVDNWLNMYGITLSPYIKRLDITEEWNTLKKCVESGKENEKIMLTVHKIIFSLSRAEVQYNALISDKTARYTDRRKIVLDIKKYIEKSATQALNIDELSVMFSISKSQLIRQFKKQYGITPYSYALECRLNIGKTLLETSDLSVDEIASKLSFCDRNHFNKAFKKQYGITPPAYRANILSDDKQL